VKKRSGLPNGVIFHEDIGLLVWKPVGIVTEPIVNTILSFLDHHETVHPRPFDRFTDTSAQEAMELNHEYVFQVALYRRMIFADRPPAKSAFYVIKPEIAQLIRIHAIVTNRSPLKVAMFEQYQAAATWLGVPLTRLQAGA
jgi:hypothetical protein